MNTFLTGLALTTTCFTGLYLLPNTVSSMNTTKAQQTAVPCSSHSSLSPSVDPEQVQSEQCHPWASF